MKVSGGVIEGPDFGLRTGPGTRVHITGGTFIATTSEFAINAGAGLAGMAEIDAGDFSSPANGVTFQQSGVPAPAIVRGGTFTGGRSGGLAIEISEVEIFGGHFKGDTDAGFDASDSSHVRVYGGVFQGSSFGMGTGENAVIEIFGGQFEGEVSGLATFEQSRVEVFAGQFEGDVSGVLVSHDSRLTIRGGEFIGFEFEALFVNNNSIVDVLGGTFDGPLSDITTSENGLIRIFGTNFSEPLGPLVPETGLVSGLFLDGTPFELAFDRTLGGAIELVPEPGTVTLASMICIVVGMGTRRRRTTQSRRD